VAFDTETTGLQPFGGDRVIEFAAVRLWLGRDGRVERTEPSVWLVNPGIPVPRKVTEITGIDDAAVAQAAPFTAIAADVAALLHDAVTVAHNYPFDLSFLTMELRNAGREWPGPLAEIDTVDLSMSLFPSERGHRLADLCARLDVPLVGAHRAVNDAAATGQCLVQLLARHQVDDDLQTLLDWAGAIGRPPEDGALAIDTRNRVVFRQGELAGRPVADHPVELAWMERARERGPDGWRWKFDASTRRWIRRWLGVRGSGRVPTPPRNPHASNWELDSCVVPDRRHERPRDADLELRAG
jgi:DNA polymerase III epsilon subunit family exonuclease